MTATSLAATTITAIFLIMIPSVPANTDERRETHLHAWGRAHLQILGPTVVSTPGDILHAWLSVPRQDGGPGSPLEPQLEGKPVRFVVNGVQVCSSVTSESGYAYCQLSLTEEQALFGFEAIFDGDPEWQPSYDRVGPVRVCNRVDPIMSFNCVDTIDLTSHEL